MSDEVVAPDPAVIEQNTSSVVGVLAEALAQHVPNMRGECDACAEPVHRPGALARHQASVVAALPNIAIVPNEGTTRRYSAAYRNFDGDIVPVGVAYSKRAWAEEVRIEWQRDEPKGKYFIVYRDVPAWQEADQ